MLTKQSLRTRDLKSFSIHYNLQYFIFLVISQTAQLVTLTCTF